MMGRAQWLDQVEPCTNCGRRHRPETPRDGACKQHGAEKQARARAKTGPRVRAGWQREWRRRTAGTPRAVAAALRTQAAAQGYQITVEERDQRLDEQGHACAVCKRLFRRPSWHLDCSLGSDPKGRKVAKSPSVDHDHQTGLVRGILCLWCNRTIVPLFDRYLETMTRAKEYSLHGGWRTE